VKARLYLDEDVVPELAVLLRAAGYDAVSVHEAGTHHWDDPRQLARAAAEGRVILTHNYKDFRRLYDEWHAAGREPAGIVVSFHQYSRKELGKARRAVLALLAAFTVEDLHNTMQILDSWSR